MGDAQDRGRAWDTEVARRVGGRRQRGSGNRVYAQLDAASGLLVVSGKHTDADSIRLTQGMVDEAAKAVLGPEAMQGGYDAVLALHMGTDLRSPALAVLDLDLLISWLKRPPEIVPATAQESLRATARVPPYLRG